MGSYWFHYLEDKIAGYLLTVGENFPAPEIKACAVSVDEMSLILKDPSIGLVSADNNFVLPLGQGIVVKATSFHSSQGVFILVNDGLSSSGNDTRLMDLITNQHLSYKDVATMLSTWQATKIIVEELVGGGLPDEYKLHTINGKVVAIDVIMNRGSSCPCYAVVDTEFNRLDYNGCFEPAGTTQQIMDEIKPECTAIDFSIGKRKAGPVKKDMYMCVDLQRPKQCVLDDMIAIAESLSKTIGVYMRIDMFVAAAGDKVYVQEYSANPMNGLRHCASKLDRNGCIDSCFLGREWKLAGEPFGGIPTATPSFLNGFLLMDPAKQCELTNSAPKVKTYNSTC
jgi:hypothetical protein